MSNLILHCGANAVERTSTEMTCDPVSLGKKHAPVAHIDYLNQVLSAVKRHGYSVVSEAHGATANGAQYFGLLNIAPAGTDQFVTDDGVNVDRVYKRDEYITAIGMRASHDQTLARGFVIGDSVFVCDNLAFTGEIEFAKKQTTFSMDRLPELVDDAMGRLIVQSIGQQERVQAYQEKELTHTEAKATVIDLMDRKAINVTDIPRVLEEWYTPRFDVFAEGQDIWRMRNALTEVYKAKEGAGSALHKTTPRSLAMTQYFDEVCGLNPEMALQAA